MQELIIVTRFVCSTMENTDANVEQDIYEAL